MARYIDADALMEMLNKKAQTDLEMGLYNHGTLTQSFIRFVERQPTADVAPRAEWISVEERLPKSDTRCIAWSFDYVWHIRFASYNSGTERWYVVCGGQIKDTKRDGVKVTHWMPLPEPPKGD